MSVITPFLIALGLGLVSFGIGYWWFGIVKRREAEVAIGISALAAMKWRECVGLVIQSLEREGYREEISSRQPGDGGTEFLLKKQDQTALLSYKHGTAYHIGEANIRDFASGVQLIGAKKGLLVTLGSIDNVAHSVSKRFDIELMDGKVLWPRIESYVPTHIREKIATDAALKTQNQLRINTGVSIVVGLLSFMAFGGLSVFSGSGDASSSLPDKSQISSNSQSDEKSASEIELEKISEAAKELEAVDNMTEQQRNQRRVNVATSVASLSNVSTAVWSTPSTLLLSLNTVPADEKPLVAEVCTILTQKEELRYTRIQLDPPAGSDAPVRFRQCQ
jgi:restriction system protein